MTAEQAREALSPLPLPVPDAMLEAALAAYEATPRVYHRFEHVVEVMSQYHWVAEAAGWRQPAEVFLAVLYHDAVYRVGSKTNEADSATLARTEVARWLGQGVVDATRVAELIELTAKHGSLSPDDIDAEAALFVDCDMAILGAEPAAYDRYARQVADEYAPVIPARAYAAGRRQFLERVVAAERVFLSPLFHERFDARARDNLRRELATLA